MRLLVVLSHLMSKDCQLGIESIARAELAISQFSCTEYDRLVTLGWDYRPDCDVPICDVVKNYIVNNSLINKNSVISIPQSRDTVGDALYCREFIGDIKSTGVNVITSDYHVYRTKIIFEKIFSDATRIEVCGVKTAANLDPSTLQHEQRSLEAFYQTFHNVDFSSKRQIFIALSENHPFYNGDIHPKLTEL